MHRLTCLILASLAPCPALAHGGATETGGVELGFLVVLTWLPIYAVIYFGARF